VPRASLLAKTFIFINPLKPLDVKLKALVTGILFFSISLYALLGQVAEIPFELEKDIVLLQVKVNDNPNPRTFVFDTGATYDLLDETVSQSLGLQPNYKQEVPGAGGVNTFDIVLSQKLTVGENTEIQGTHLVLHDLSTLQEALERDFDGILGYSLLKSYVTRIDFDQQKLVLYTDIDQLSTAGYTAVPFKLDNGIPIPQFDITITLENGVSYTGKILFDSGAAYSLIVNTPFNRTHKLGESAQKRLILESNNLASKSFSEQIAIRSMTVAGMELGEMVIALAQDKDGVSSYKGYLGILGAKVISRFDVIIDYTTSTLYLKPNARYSEPFEFPLSGIALKKNPSGVVVRQVQQSSPAYASGVRKGDRVLAINKDRSGDIEQYRELLKQEGKTCTLLLTGPDGQSKEVTIKLERLL
jgi:hypothetical protein